MLPFRCVLSRPCANSRGSSPDQRALNTGLVLAGGDRESPTEEVSIRQEPRASEEQMRKGLSGR